MIMPNFLMLLKTKVKVCFLQQILFGKEYDNELCRVIIHSILHLCGIDDKSPDERAQMERAEDMGVEQLFWIHRQ